MAMTIMNNNGAALSLGELNKNISRAGKDLKKLASGMKLNGAGDDASGYAISEKMRTRLRALVQDDQNVQNGVSLLKIASGGIEEITNELRSLKELAINAANDTNTDVDRATIPKEFDQRRAQIDEIASGTTYNGKVLLDGRYGRKSVSGTETTVIPGTPGRPGTIGRSATPVDASVIGLTSRVVHSGAIEPTGTPTTINTDSYTITRSGVYELDSGAGTISVAAGVHDVKFVQAAGATLEDIHITGPSDGGANFWMEDLTVTNSDTSSFIRFQGADNFLNFKGTNSINVLNRYSEGIIFRDTNKAIINAGNGLTVEGGTDGSGFIIFNDSVNIIGACIGSDAFERGTGAVPITVNSGTFTSNVTDYRQGALIGGGGDAHIGDLTVNGGTFIDNSLHDVTIGTGSSSRRAQCGNIVVKNAKIVALYKEFDPTIGSATESGECGNIYIANCDITVWNKYAAGIGSAQYSEWTSGIVIENSILDIQSDTGAGIGSGEEGAVGDITLNRTDVTSISSNRGENIGRGLNGRCGRVRYDVPVDPSFIPAIEGIPATPGTPERVVTTDVDAFIDNPLVIHHGTKSNEALHLYINDMRTTTLKGEGDDRTLDQASVRTRRDASDAMDIIDGALDYALGEATTVGADISRLYTTDANIVTMNETTTASESTIRDADMAKEMASYMKNNVLMQASQSMLAQANRSSSDVLKLLQ
ncbi:MAG: flagellin [Selenomonadaceae bacterium]|nr:flagellin [Selenomonadaceae bacterium]